MFHGERFRCSPFPVPSTSAGCGRCSPHAHETAAPAPCPATRAQALPLQGRLERQGSIHPSPQTQRRLRRWPRRRRNPQLQFRSKTVWVRDEGGMQEGQVSIHMLCLVRVDVAAQALNRGFNAVDGRFLLKPLLPSP